MSSKPETGYGQRIREALTWRNLLLFLFGAVVGGACYYGAVHYGG